jgi:hypothetical protein
MNAPLANPSDFSALADCQLAEVRREAGACLDGTIHLALAADQRGGTMSGIIGVAAVVLLVTAAAYGTAAPLTAAFLVTSAGLFGAAILAAWSGRPRSFFVAGYEPRLLAQCGGDIGFMRRCIIADIQNRIDQNRVALDRAARQFVAAMIVAAVSPAAGAAAYFVLG